MSHRLNLSLNSRGDFAFLRFQDEVNSGRVGRIETLVLSSLFSVPVVVETSLRVGFAFTRFRFGDTVFEALIGRGAICACFSLLLRMGSFTFQAILIAFLVTCSCIFQSLRVRLGLIFVKTL